MKLVQSVLLAAYRTVRRTGMLDRGIGRAAFEHAYLGYKSWIEARELDALRPYVTPGSTVVDVGANIGFFARRFAEWTGPSGRVIAIEPETRNFESLRARLAPLGTRAVLVNAAAVEEPGEVFLELNPDNPADHRVAQSGERVAAVSIDTLLETNPGPKVSFVKVDVQGGELRVLRGARRTLAASRPALFIEFHEPSLRAAGTSPQELLSELAGQRYAAHLLDRDRTPIDASTLFEVMRTRGYVDVLFLPT
jgi:FkbM family methyltransferase